MNWKTIALALSFLAIAAWADFAGYGLQTRGAFLDKFDPDTGGWYPIAITAVMLCFFFNLIIYMAGMALQAENLKRYARAEFLQTTASALIIFFAVALLYDLSGASGGSGGAFAIMGKLIGKEQSSVSCNSVSGGRYYIWSSTQFGGGPIGAFKCKIQDKITALDKQYSNIEQANRGTERLTSLCINLFGFPVWCYDWDLRLHKEVEESHLLANKIVSLLIPLHGQFVLADYVQKNMLSIFLPLGLLLRILPPTRGVGGLFIAIAIGFYFVWPTFSVLTDPTFVREEGNQIMDKTAGVCFTGFKGVAILVNSAYTSGVPGDNTLANASGRELLYQMTIGTIFYPFVALVITLIFVRAMTPILGGDMGELMKMVSRLG